MTEDLFLSDAYVREFGARVSRMDGRELVLDRTAFYPGGGGQPADKGEVGIGPVNALVVDARREGRDVVHVLDRPIPGTVRELKGRLDWERRYAHMRHHTALHVLSAVMEGRFGAKVTGGRMRADGARMDFSFPGEWTAGVVSEAERLTNEALAQGSDVRVYWLSREEVAADPALIRTRTSLIPEGIERVRVVEIEGIDVQADGGTHVANTREVGEIEVTGHRSKGRENKRVEFVLR